MAGLTCSWRCGPPQCYRGKRVIIGKRCQHNVAAGEIGELCDGACAGQCRCPLRLAVIGQHLVTVFDKIGRKSVTHMAEADHTNTVDNEPGSLLKNRARARRQWFDLSKIRGRCPVAP